MSSEVETAVELDKVVEAVVEARTEEVIEESADWIVNSGEALPESPNTAEHNKDKQRCRPLLYNYKNRLTDDDVVTAVLLVGDGDVDLTVRELEASRERLRYTSNKSKKNKNHV